MKRVLISILFLIVGIILISEVRNYQLAQELKSQEFQLADTQVYLIDEEISALLPMEDYLWVGGKDGVKRVDYDTGEVIDYVLTDIELIYAASMIVSSTDESVWIGHNDGVTVLLADGSRLDFTDPQMTGGRVNAILETETGIYVGTMQGCTLFTYEASTWTISYIYNEDSGLASAPVNVITQIQGSIWFGSYLDSNPGGISILSESGEWYYLSTDDGLSHPYINAIIEVGDYVYVGSGQLTFGGLSEISLTSDGPLIMDTYDTEDNIPGAKVRHLYLDSNGYFWITTESDGLIITSSINGLTHPIDGLLLTYNNGLSDDEIKCIVETEDAYWLGGRYGLTCILKDTIVSLMEEETYEK